MRCLPSCHPQCWPTQGLFLTLELTSRELHTKVMTEIWAALPRAPRRGKCGASRPVRSSVGYSNCDVSCSQLSSGLIALRSSPENGQRSRGPPVGVLAKPPFRPPRTYAPTRLLVSGGEGLPPTPIVRHLVQAISIRLSAPPSLWLSRGPSRARNPPEPSYGWGLTP